MKIQGNKPPEGHEVSLSSKKVSKVEGNAKPSPEKTGSTDRIEISPKGKELAEMIAIAKQLPDIRTDKVNAIKESIDAGNYNIDPLKIAEKILSEL